MIYREYGKTGKKISILSLGGTRFRSKDYEKDFEYPVKVIRKASELGINFFDTAPLYCDGKSENIFGEAFKKMPNKFYISTKSRVLRDPTADKVRKRIDISLVRLGVSKIDFYDMWAISSEEEYKAIIKKGGPLAGAMKAKDEGLISHITFSSRLPDKNIVKIIKSGYFEGVTLGYNAINYPTSENAIKVAAKKGLGVVIMNPLASGFITRYPDYFRFLKEDKKASVAQAALHFVMSTPGVTTALCGTGSEANLRDNAAGSDRIKVYSPVEFKKIKNKINEHLPQLCNSCNECIARCPRNIHIPMYMDVYNLKLIQDNKTVIRKRLVERKSRPLYNPNNSARLCDGCQKCEELCPKHLDIAKRMDYIALNIEVNK